MSNIVVPELGESVVEARIAKWLKKPGDRVEVGDALVELETEKIDLEVSAEKSGVLASIARQEGEDVKIGELLAVVDESGTAAPAPPAPAAAAKADAKPAVAANGSANGAAADDLRATPTARRVAKDHDVNLENVQGTGSAGRVMKQDVQAAIAPAPAKTAKPAPAAEAPAPTPAPAPAAAKSDAKPAGLPAGNRGETRVRMTKRRETIARRLVEAQHN